MPSQDFLKEKTVAYILRCYFQKKEEDLPPSPIVRVDPETKKYIAIDGHNLLAVNDLLNKKTKVYIALSPHDTIVIPETGLPESIIQRNKDLKEKYDSCILEAKSVTKKGITSFTILRKQYPFLLTVSNAKKYVGII